MKKSGLLLCGILTLFYSIMLFSCNRQEMQVKFAKEEEAEIQLETEKILNEFGYDNYKIFTYFHKLMGQKLWSRAITSNKAVGNGLLPLFDQLTDSTGYSSGMTNSFDGYFEHRAVTENYNGDAGNKYITYDYISIIIIFDEISIEQKNELLKLLNIYVVNSNRGDIIYIISRDEMQNNK